MEAPQRQEVDHRTIKLIVGLIALSLASLTSALAPTPIGSISAAYYAGGWSQTIFIGFLFAIAAFLAAYNGKSKTEMRLSKLASAAALGIALFPCECEGHQALVPYLHGVCAAALFIIQAGFCYGFYQRARAKTHPEANRRAVVYALCGSLIVACVLLLGIDHLTAEALTQHLPRLVFYGEAAGLVAFGVSWLTASRTLPLLTATSERFHPLTDINPD